MTKIRDQILKLRKLGPKASKYGQLYAEESELKWKFSSIRLYALFVSSDGDLIFRDHVFESRTPRSGADWYAWFTTKVNAEEGDQTPPLTIGRLEFIQKDAVLPAIFERTGMQKHWAVKKVIGWRGNVEQLPDNSSVVRKRNKAKSKGRKT